MSYGVFLLVIGAALMGGVIGGFWVGTWDRHQHFMRGYVTGLRAAERAVDEAVRVAVGKPVIVIDGEVVSGENGRGTPFPTE